MLDILFYMLAASLVGSSLAVVLARNPIISILSLIVAFFAASGLFILLQAEYLAFTLIIVYIGAVAVLFLFVVMLINVRKESLKSIFTHNKKSFIALFFILLAEMVFLLASKTNFCSHDDLSIFSMDAMKGLSNMHALGMLLYTHHFLAFQLSGIVLLVAMISAILLVHEKRSDRRRQKIRDQLMRSKAETLEIISIPPYIKESE